MPGIMLADEGVTAADTVTSALTGAMTTTANNITSAIGSILPIALGVAGTILVITIGWRLFRNFTHG